MEQNQMSKFCIDLEGMMLPDAIAAIVEAWYDAQTTDKRIDKDDFGFMYNKARVPAVTTEDVQKMNQALAASNGSRLEAFFVRPF
jgi:hypothetical protein